MQGTGQVTGPQEAAHSQLFHRWAVSVLGPLRPLRQCLPVLLLANRPLVPSHRDLYSVPCWQTGGRQSARGVSDFDLGKYFSMNPFSVIGE